MGTAPGRSRVHSLVRPRPYPFLYLVSDARLGSYRTSPSHGRARCAGLRRTSWTPARSRARQSSLNRRYIRVPCPYYSFPSGSCAQTTVARMGCGDDIAAVVGRVTRPDEIHIAFLSLFSLGQSRVCGEAEARCGNQNGLPIAACRRCRHGVRREHWSAVHGDRDCAAREAHY